MAAKNSGQKSSAGQEAPKQRPAFECRYGRLRATIWKQESDKGPWYTVVLTRSYQDQQGEWHSAQSFGRDDLLVVAKLCDQAHTWIHREMAKNAKAAAPGTDPANGNEPPEQLELGEIPF